VLRSLSQALEECLSVDVVRTQFIGLLQLLSDCQIRDVRFEELLCTVRDHLTSSS